MYLLKGLLIGLIFGLPIGSIGTLSLKRTINKNWKYGFVTGLSSTTADVVYALIGVCGITFISDFLLKYQNIIGLVGCIYIFFLGINSIIKNKDYEEINTSKGLVKTYLSTLIIGITNPASILTFIYAFTMFDILSNINIVSGCALITGIILGTVIWWTLLVIAGSFIKEKAKEKYIVIINKILGFILIFFSILIIINIIW